MKFKTLILSILAVVVLALTACQAMEALDAAEPTFEAALETAVAEDFAGEATPAPVEEQAAYEPVFEPTECWFALPEGQPVECGYLVVPENRGDPDSPNIRIAVAILRHPGGNPQPDPIFYIHGGPGGGFMSVLDLEYPTIANFFETNRDVIYFDQRGNGLSEPSLDCPDFAPTVGDLYDLTLDGQSLTLTEAQDHLLGVLVACGETWRETVDLSTYDSATSAADINDLRRALGYDRINIYAESYGPRVAQSVMRDYPDIVRSAVLDAAMSTYSPLEDFPTETGQMLRHLFDLCAADEACNAAFPDLGNVWLATLRDLTETPVSLKSSDPLSGEELEFLVDGHVLATVLWRLSYSNSALPAIPGIIYGINEGDYAVLEQALGGVPAWVSVVGWGQLLNVTCRERASISSAEDFEVALEAYPETRDFWEGNLFLPQRTLFDESLCEAWGGGAIPASEQEPVASAIPTLLVLGDTDPAASLEESTRIAEPLENHFGPYLYPFLSHVVFGSHPCPTGMVTAFIADPAAEPEASCIGGMGVEFDIPGEGGDIVLAPFTNAEMNYTTVIPDGWNEIMPGAYARGNPAIDPTILAQLAAPNSEAEAFIGDILGNLGVAALPETPARSLDTEALAWSIYLAPGEAMVAVALAEDGANTYLVALKAKGDEFDALADELLAPAIMAFTPANQ